MLISIRGCMGFSKTNGGLMRYINMCNMTIGKGNGGSVISETR